MKTLLVALVSFGIASCGGEPPLLPAAEVAEIPQSRAPLRTGLWVLAEGSHRTLEDPGKLETLLEDALTLGISDLFVQVYRGGRSWYASSHADPAPHQKLLAIHGQSPLPALVASAHEKGVRVHAWFNALSLARNRKAPLLQSVGDRAVLVDRRGRSLLSYRDLEVPASERTHTRMGTPGVWLDPAVPGVIEYLEATLDDLIAAVPDLDGLHLDFIRHPLTLPIVPGSGFDVGLDFGYGRASQARFEAAQGQSFRRGDAWDAFRRDRVTEVVRRLHARLPEAWEMSAAVIPWADRAYLSAMQDWRGWLEQGLLDFAVAMAYTKDDRLLGYLSGDLSGGTGGDRLWIGLGSWLFLRDPPRMQRQLDIALRPKPAGVAIFSYDALAPERELVGNLRVVHP